MIAVSSKEPGGGALSRVVSVRVLDKVAKLTEPGTA